MQYSPTEALALFNAAELRPVTRFPDPEGKYNLWVLERPAVSFLPLERVLDMPVLDMQAVELTSRDGKGQTGVPSLDEWETVWAFWDTVSIGMIRNEMLHEKPIDLRHKSAFFYLFIPRSSRLSTDICTNRLVLLGPYPSVLGYLPFPTVEGTSL